MDIALENSSIMNDVKSLPDNLEESFLQEEMLNVESALDSSDSGDLTDKEIIGQRSTIKTLHEGPKKCQCCINWVEERPKDLGPTFEQQAESRRHALLVRMKMNHDSDERKPLALDSIVVQSPHLKALLGRVFEDYNGITTSLQRLVFKAPFRPFFYEWEKLKEIVQHEPDTICREHGLLLLKTLRTELKDTIELSEDHARNGVITFRDLWTIFKPGIEVYASREGYDALYKLANSDYKAICGVNIYRLDVRQVDFDGKGFGYKRTVLDIQEFEGTVAVGDLDAYPAKLHPRIDDVRKRLAERGIRFQELQAHGPRYKSYEGLVDLSMDPSGMMRRAHKIHIDGRVIVDPSSYWCFNPFERVDLKPLIDNSFEHKWDFSEAQGHNLHFPELTPRDFMDDMHPMCGRAPSSPFQQMRKTQVPENMLHLCSPQVRGYSFKIKKWVTFWIELIDEVKWNEQAFESLVLPSDYKRLMLSFVDSQIRNKELFDDVIEGKGQGIVILLEGSPGVGKTLTAEALADRLRKPLYAMSIAELGNSAHDLESRLMMILEMAVKWDAVVLLDESDVFLEKRSPNDLQRNGIVAIFLRLLEYFRGVMFMTTNRVQAMDPAFQSRIHLKIQYPDLQESARSEIWKQMVAMSGEKNALGAHDLKLLAREDFNGREIKNLVKSARLLASYEDVPLSMDHIESVLRVTKTVE